MYTNMSSYPFHHECERLSHLILLLIDKIIWTIRQAIHWFHSLFLFSDASNYLKLHWKANYKICNLLSCLFIHKTFLAGFMILWIYLFLSVVRRSFFKLRHMLNICDKGLKVIVTPALYKECTLIDECVTLNLVWLKSLVSTTQMVASPYEFRTYNVRFSHYIQGTLLHPLKNVWLHFFTHNLDLVE